MDENTKTQIRNCYDLTAQKYADAFLDEMEKKPFDANLLRRFTGLMPKEGCVVDFGTGCGHIAAFLNNCGVPNVYGMDISGKSLQIAAQKFPRIRFVLGDMTDSGLKKSSFHGIVCFYGIVHMKFNEVREAFIEWERIMVHGAKGLISFHIGEGEVKVENFLGTEGASAIWKFFQPEEIVELIEKTGLLADEVVIRFPYKDVEHPSKRCYILFSKV